MLMNYIYIYVEQPIIDAKILNMFNISTILVVPTENRIIIISCMISLYRKKICNSSNGNKAMEV